jgi:hypothetical protein
MLVYINPLEIQNFIEFKNKKIIANYKNLDLDARRFNGDRFTGLIVEDNAIRTGDALKQCPHFIGTVQRFYEKLDWHKTEYKILHKSWYQKINNGKYKDKSFEEFYEHRLKKWDKIFKEIKTQGYKKSKNQHDSVEIAISGKGKLLLIDGRHRVAFAQILKLKQIPVIINIISETLVRSFKDETFANSFSNRNIAEAVADNSMIFSRQLSKDIKGRLAIASMGAQP